MSDARFYAKGLHNASLVEVNISPDPDDPRPRIQQLLNEGAYREVIREFHPDETSIPKDPRTFLGLSWAHMTNGTLEIAQRLVNAAIDHYRESREDVYLATAIANQAALEWRQIGYESAIATLQKALCVDPKCEMAWCNLLCYSSFEAREDFDTFLSQFIAANPEWDTQEVYWQSLFSQDADLSWARRRKSFEQIRPAIRKAQKRQARLIRDAVIRDAQNREEQE